jgi:hypothetical protein
VRGAVVLVGFVPAVALVSCHAILGIGDLDVEPGRPDTGSPRPVDASPSDVGPEEEPPVIVPESDGAPGSPTRVFLTSDTTTGAFKGAAGATEKCRTAAERAKLGGDWVAWVSDATKAAAEQIGNGPFVLVNGARLAPTKEALLSGSIGTTIDVLENGGRRSDDYGTWTGTLRDGGAGANCSNWTIDTATDWGTAGNPGKTDGEWTERATEFAGSPGWHCSWPAHIICFER